MYELDEDYYMSSNDLANKYTENILKTTKSRPGNRP